MRKRLIDTTVFNPETAIREKIEFEEKCGKK